MATIKGKPFTTTSIDKHPPAAAGERDYYPDPETRGLKVRVTDAGVKSFVFEARVKGGRKVTETIGTFPSCTVAKAREVAKKLSAQLVDGIDPRDSRRRANADPMFGELFAWYLAEGKPGLKPSTRDTYLGLFTRYLASFDKRKATAITKAEIRELHRKITASQGAPYGANRMLALVRAVYNAAKRWDKFDGTNPAEGIERNREEKRETRLFPGQIAGLFKAIDAYTNEAMRDLFALCLLTGQRVGSIKSMAWVDIHLEDRIWVIPDTKNNRPQNVPLEDDEIAILERRKASSGASPWVFPSNSASGHLESPNNAWEAIIEAAGIPPKGLRIHDLRRSLGSFMVDSGASLPTIGKTLGHLSPTTTAIYARLSLDPVREAKLQAHQVIAAARASDKVVELAQRRAAK